MSCPFWAKPKILIIEIILLVAFVVSFAVIPFFDWKFAIILTALVLAHEIGHIWAMHRYGMRLKYFFFIPFLGAIVSPETSEFPSEAADAWVSLMGPLWGLGSALFALALWCLTGAQVFHQAAFYAIILNLFNLILLYPIDGGRLMRCLTHALSPLKGIIVFTCLNIISLTPIVLAVVLTVYAAKKMVFPWWFIAVNIVSLVVLLVAVIYGSYTEWREKMLLIWYGKMLIEQKKGILQRRLDGDPDGSFGQKLSYAASIYRSTEEYKLRGRQIITLILVYLASGAALIGLMVFVVRTLKI